MADSCPHIQDHLDHPLVSARIGAGGSDATGPRNNIIQRTWPSSVQRQTLNKIGRTSKKGEKSTGYDFGTFYGIFGE